MSRLAERAHLVLHHSHREDTDELARVIREGFEVHKASDAYPDCRRIDLDNRIGYSDIAEDFVDELRLTTADFHHASAPHLSRILRGTSEGSRLLEVGAGRGWLREAVETGKAGYSCQESSAGMARYLPDDVMTEPIRALFAQRGGYDHVVGSLVDGMAYPLGVFCLAQLLAPAGRIVLTWPSSVWSTGRRRTTRTTQFVSSNGRTVRGVHSFTPDRIRTKELFRLAGLELTEFVECPPVPPTGRPYSADTVLADGSLPESLVSIAVGVRQ
ncbi:class I SAM-dependent methyltransferase [Streptomyces sp. ISL-11]|uniref:class I SAM-dependent methyltransferase n=1 Tax=Streptomyces sp. ISL-11 TaxID=2819174 RepID=UPI001BECF081|nr:class I SAM-dependent methyltransferase [Streptomyces sp. ISL-11]MBT2385297.1 hypothetical protein [Streptomyces sp. ISL-11]